MPLPTLHEEATSTLKRCLERYFTTQEAPSEAERRSFCYPELVVHYEAHGVVPSIPRAYAKFQGPGIYITTVTHPAHFRRYLLEQLTHLVRDYGATIEVARSDQEIPYPYVLDKGDDLGRDGITAAELALHFPVPQLALVGDEIADGQWDHTPGDPLPLALFDAVRVDYSLKRLQHYTGTDWHTSALDPADQLSPLRRPVRALEHRAIGGRWPLSGAAPAGRRRSSHAACREPKPTPSSTASPWHRFQMPAYHLTRNDGQGGVTLVNIGVGPSNAKNITDHLAVLRPHCWLMIGHCGGLAPVAAHRRLRAGPRLFAPGPHPRQPGAAGNSDSGTGRSAGRAAGRSRARSPASSGEALKQRLRTGTVVTNDDRNWELRWTQERKRINLSRAIAVDMESGTLAAQGYRLRVPYGTLLCVSDKPLHGEIKLPGAANAFYDRAVGEHLLIGLRAVDDSAENCRSFIRASCAASTSRRSVDATSVMAAPHLLGT